MYFGPRFGVPSLTAIDQFLIRLLLGRPPVEWGPFGRGFRGSLSCPRLRFGLFPTRPLPSGLVMPTRPFPPGELCGLVARGVSLAVAAKSAPLPWLGVGGLPFISLLLDTEPRRGRVGPASDAATSSWWGVYGR